MGFKPMTLHGPIWGLDFFRVNLLLVFNIMYLLFHLKYYTHLGGWLAASKICINVTACIEDMH